MNLIQKIGLLIFLISFFWLRVTNTVYADNENLFLTQTAQNNSLGQEIYLQNCSDCHIPIPAEVLPTERWRDILNNSDNHYGQKLPTSVKVTARLMWAYLRNSSRPANPGERLPEYVTDSRYLKALHPQVELPKPTNHQSCAACHPAAARLDYRTLADEFKD